MAGSAADSDVTACVLIIGNEILSGRTKDANLSYLGEQLDLLGVRLLEARVVPDIPDAIVTSLNEVRGRFDYVFTTGGIGPTHDDITAECVAAAFGVPLIQNPGGARHPGCELRARRTQRIPTAHGQHAGGCQPDRESD